MRRILSVLAAPVIAALLLATVALFPQEPDAAGVRQAAVGETAYACSSAPTILTGQVAAGTRSQALGSPGGEELEDVADPTRWVRSERSALSGRPDAVLVTQRGERSGAVGFAHGRLGEASGGGLVVAPCAGVVDDAWYTGLGSGRRQDSRVVLSNVGATPAVADLRLWSPAGGVDAVDADGVVVEPGATRIVRLADLAAGESELALQVERRRGALAVGVLDTATGAAAGSEAVDASLAPATEQLVGGLPAGARGRTLHLVNPGETTARVAVEALGADGAFVPEGLDDVSVAPASTTSVDLPAAVGDGAAGLRVTSDVPVAAGVRVDTGGTDVAAVAAASAWSGDAVVPLGGGLPSPDLAVTADGAAGVLELEAVDAELAPVASATVEVAEETSTTVDLADVLDLDGAVAVIVRQGEDAVVSGSAVYADGDLLATFALRAAPREAPVPPVRYAP